MLEEKDPAEASPEERRLLLYLFLPFREPLFAEFWLLRSCGSRQRKYWQGLLNFRTYQDGEGVRASS